MRSVHFIACVMCLLALADSAIAATDGVYHPYVSRNERELEYGVTWRGIGDHPLSYQRVSFAYAWADHVSTELYLLSESPSHSQARIRGYELETKWQLTEQGEFWADFGLLFEIEGGKGFEERELSVALLVEKELGNRWVAAANGIVEYEFGDLIENEFETALRAQLRYLKSPAFEPAIELYLDDQDYAIGPALLGAYRFSAGKQIRWDIGLPLGIKHDTPSTSLRINLEFEF